MIKIIQKMYDDLTNMYQSLGNDSHRQEKSLNCNIAKFSNPIIE